MAAGGLLAPLLWALLAAPAAPQRSDMRLAYVTDSSLFYYSCVQDPRPCAVSSLADCRCKDLQLSTLQRPLAHSAPVFRMRRLTVWYTSPSNAARLLNNSEVRHLTLIHCGPEGSRESVTRGSVLLEGHFAVQHLERLSVVNLPQEARGGDSDQGGDNGDRYGGADTNLDLFAHLDARSEGPPGSWSPPPSQDILLGRELGAPHHEQARLGIIHNSVLQCGAAAKVYTVQTHIDSQGALPFPELRLPKLPETSVIYVSFVY